MAMGESGHDYIMPYHVSKWSEGAKDGRLRTADSIKFLPNVVDKQRHVVSTPACADLSQTQHS